MSINRGWKDAKFPPECRRAMWNGTCKYVEKSSNAPVPEKCEEPCPYQEGFSKYYDAAARFETMTGRPAPCHFEQGKKWQDALPSEKNRLILAGQIKSGTRRNAKLRTSI